MTPARQTAAYDRHVLGPGPAERARDAARELTEAELYEQLQAELRASARELLRDPATLARGLDGKFRMRPHVRAISDAFVDVANGRTQKVMLLTPPQVGKSTLAAVWAPFWWLAKNPDHRIIVACYGSSLANARGRSVRKLVREHGAEYDLALDPGSSAVNDWLMTTGGGMRSVGIGGSITGHSADCVAGGTELVTPSGRVTVDRFVRAGATVPVLAWDHAEGRAVFRRVEATRSLRARPVMRLETKHGRVLRCTPDHRVWAPGRGYLAAGRLRSGDVLQGVAVGGHARLLPEWDVLSSVRYSRGAEWVYDLQVAGTRNFFADGLLVHNCLIIDDPHKNRQEADSHAMREAVHDSYSADLTSRLAPGAPTILIQTRWSPDDLAGRLLAEEGDDREGGEWRVVHMPAFADLSLTGGSDPLGRRTGDPLPHPKIPTRDKARLRAHWEKKKAGSKARDWGALYQGDPQPGEGALATEELMRQILDLRPEAEPMKVAVAVDPSGGGRDNAGIIGGFLGDDQRVYWTHDRSAVMSSEEWSRAACVLAHETDASVIVCETNFGGDMCLLAIRTAWDALQREGAIPEEKLPPQVKAVQAKAGKLLRAEPILQQMVEDRVRMAAKLQSLVHQWTHWQPTNPDSPGELDAAVYLVYALLRVPGAGAVMSSPAQVHQRQVAPQGWAGMPAQRPLPQGPIP